MTPERLSNNDREAQRRIIEGARMIRSGIRLGGDPEFAAREVRMQVRAGAEAYAEDTVEAYIKASA